MLRGAFRSNVRNLTEAAAAGEAALQGHNLQGLGQERLAQVTGGGVT